MNRKTKRNFSESVRLSTLKGISIYFEDDFYEAAKLLLRLYDARQRHFNETGKRRPTVHGMIRSFADLTNVTDPRYDYVKDQIVKANLPLDGVIRFDEE